MKKFLVLIILVVLVVCGYHFYNDYKFNQFIKKIESDKISIDDFYVYGNHLNFSGTTNIKNGKLILKSKNKELEYDINIKDDEFYLSKKINEGINLDKLGSGKYYVLLKSNDKYYSFENNTKYKNVTYYSTIKNNKTNKMNINFNKYFNIDSKSISPKGVYDITIDAGHGGDDTGAINGSHYEADYTYEYAIALKKKLESKGYTVKLTRDENDGIKTYGKHSRTAIPYESHSKLVISIHFNSSESYISQTGFEVYALDNSNLSFAYDLTNNLDKNTSLTYSTNTAYLKDKGVYLKYFRQSDIDYMNNQADLNGYNYYNITSSTPYLYMLRETGGRITNAFVDGRNTKYEANPYYKSNIGIEAYLLELGYINNNKDLKVIDNEKSNFINSIADSIDKYMKK